MKTIAERTSARIARNAKLRERNIRDALDERVKQYGGVTRAVAWLGRVGAPDVLCLFPGRTVWVETKKSDGKVAFSQKMEHSNLQLAGCEVLVITTLEELDKAFPL